MFLHTRPHSSVYPTEAITEGEWTVFLHLPYSPEHMPSDFHLFDPLKGMLFFSPPGERSLLTNVWTIFKNNCAINSVGVKL